MTYEEMKEEYIKTKKEELEFINEAVKLSNERKLTEYEILTICRKSYYYMEKINDILRQMKRDMYLEKRKLREEGKLEKDSVALEFDVNNEFLSRVEPKYLLNMTLWIDPETLKCKVPYTHPGYTTYPLNFLNKENRIEGIYLSCGVCDTSDSITCEYLCGIYYYLDYYMKLEIPYYEIPVNDIKAFEKDKIIIQNEAYVHLDEAKKIYNEEFLNENNHSILDIAKSTQERIHELSYSRDLNVKKKVLLDKIDGLYEKVKGNLVSLETIYKGDFLELLKEVYTLPNGKTVAKEKVVKNAGKNAVIVLAITDNNEFIITMQNRINNTKIAEFPAGYIEEGEDPIETAKRELMEETGYQSDDLYLLDEILTSPGIDNSTTFIVVANNCIKTSDTKFDGTELVAYSLFSKEELKYMVDDNIINGAANKLAYYLYSNNKEKILKKGRFNYGK